MTQKKYCTVCKESKPYTDFYMTYNMEAYRYKSECKSCTNARNKISRQLKNKKKKRVTIQRKLYMHDYNKANRDKFRVYQSNFQKRNPTYFRDYMRRKRAKERTNNQVTRDALTEKDIA